jgi:uncharacterized membrane protein
MAKPDLSAEHPDGVRARPESQKRGQLPGGANSEAAGASDKARTTHARKTRHHPVVLAQQAQRSQDVQLRIADGITAFAGSMNFVYLHVGLFAVWMLFIESKPWPMLTLIVSLEAIFLSTFVMIGQNRQAAFQQAKADHDFEEQELELKTNTQLTREIHTLTTELHSRLLDGRNWERSAGDGKDAARLEIPGGEVTAWAGPGPRSS